MKNKIIIFLFTISLPLRLVADFAFKEQEVVSIKNNGNQEIISKTERRFFVKNNLVRIDEPDGPVQIINLSNYTCVVYNPKEKTFSLMNLYDCKKRKEKKFLEKKEWLKNIELNINNLTGSAQLDAGKEIKLWKTRLFCEKGFYELKETPIEKKIMGFNCKKFIGLCEGKKFQELWVPEEFPFSTMEFQRFIKEIALLEPYRYPYFRQLQTIPFEKKTQVEDCTIQVKIDAFSMEDLPVSVFLIPDNARMKEENSAIPSLGD